MEKPNYVIESEEKLNKVTARLQQVEREQRAFIREAEEQIQIAYEAIADVSKEFDSAVKDATSAVDRWIAQSNEAKTAQKAV